MKIRLITEWGAPNEKRPGFAPKSSRLKGEEEARKREKKRKRTEEDGSFMSVAERVTKVEFVACRVKKVLVLQKEVEKTMLKTYRQSWKGRAALRGDYLGS